MGSMSSRTRQQLCAVKAGETPWVELDLIIHKGWEEVLTSSTVWETQSSIESHPSPSYSHTCRTLLSSGSSSSKLLNLRKTTTILHIAASHSKRMILVASVLWRTVPLPEGLGNSV